MVKEMETAEQRHRHLQEGREGDRIAGFEPAAAPMETDAQAAGHATERPIVPPRDTDPAAPNAPSFGNAMRPPLSTPERRYFTPITLAVIAVALILAAMLLW